MYKPVTAGGRDCSCAECGKLATASDLRTRVQLCDDHHPLRWYKGIHPLMAMTADLAAGRVGRGEW